jgi:cytochrome o ubiquinol oxidase operon protein cyoD
MNKPRSNPANLTSYAAGFILSILLTLSAYFSVTLHLLTGWTLLFAILTPAFIQLIVQLVFFLHLDREATPRWNLLVLLFTITIVIILVAGSIWIMHNLNYNMMQGSQLDTYILKQEAIPK